MTADAALYGAKDTGRGRTCRYRPSLALRPSPGEEREEIAAILRDRGHRRSPSSSSPSSSSPPAASAGYEALARFRRRAAARARRVVRPGAPRRASARSSRPPRCVPRWPSPAAPSGTFLAVNVTPRALARPAVIAALPDDLSAIVVELTEHELFGAEGELEAELAALRARGARVALDDAGAGYAGLQQIIRDRARHPQARPLARPRRPRRPGSRSRCWRR